ERRAARGVGQRRQGEVPSLRQDARAVSRRGRMMALFAAALIAALSLACAHADAQTATKADDSAVRPFTVHVPQPALHDRRRRIAATRGPDRETVTDQAQGVQLDKLQALARYWGTEYDWRKAEARLNALPQFVTTIDGVDIHFIHARSRQPNAMPLLITHG